MNSADAVHTSQRWAGDKESHTMLCTPSLRVNWPSLVDRIEQGFRCPRSPYHGPSHWRAVATAGAMLCRRTPDADWMTVQLFALLHDCERVDDGDDPRHGERAAALVRSLAAEGTIRGSETEIERLAYACADHAHGYTVADPTIGVCWDSDRLNLWRVGVPPSPEYLSTAAARDVDLTLWAMTLHDTAPSWDAIRSEAFDPTPYGGPDTSWDLAEVRDEFLSAL